METGHRTDVDRTALAAKVLTRGGVRLRPDEALEVAIDLESGLTEDLERTGAALLLTNQRIVHFTSDGRKTTAAALEDVLGIEVHREERGTQWVWGGLIFVVGGVLLGVLSILLMEAPLSPILMAVSLDLIGVVFMLTYVGALKGDVVVRTSHEKMECRMRQKALDDLMQLIERFYQIKFARAANRAAG